MNSSNKAEPVRAPARSRLFLFLIREWPYLAMLALALFGVACTSVAHQPLTFYWLALTPFIGIVCVITAWKNAEHRDQRPQLIWTQALHWGAVLVAMYLISVADVSRMMNADARALLILTLLALGTFTAGVHIMAWRTCVVGIILGLCVPAIAWLEQSTLLIMLIVVVLISIAVPLWWRDAKSIRGN